MIGFSFLNENGWIREQNRRVPFAAFFALAKLSGGVTIPYCL